MTRFIVLYGPPKCRKTGACSYVTGAKWIVTDSNSIPTLSALDRMPPSEDIYEISNLLEAKTLIGEMIDAASKGGLPVPAIIFDSVTAMNDWAQQDVAAATGQTFMGANPKQNGWQQFNSEFGSFIDDLAELSRHVTVIAICHAKEKMDASKGDWSGLNLPPQMALKVGRTANWVLYQSIRAYSAEKGAKSDGCVTITELPNGTAQALECIIHTQNCGMWIAGANARNLLPEEPADMAKLLAKEGLLA
jgi:hypothetical protein